MALTRKAERLPRPGKLREPLTESKGLTIMVAQVPTIRKAAVSGPRQHAWIRALDRARLVSTRKPTYAIATDSYRVYSARADVEYAVHPTEVDGELTYHCDCKAGMEGLICWHCALIAALPYECERRRKHREARRAERLAAARVNPLDECYGTIAVN